jgi:glutamine amidotransferase
VIAIIDYGVGNLFSLKSSLEYIGAKAIVTSDKDKIHSAEKIILPGVGAFGDAAKKLEKTGLKDIVLDEVKSGKYLLGICLGMQLLFDKSYEYGEHFGLGLISGDVIPIKNVIPNDYKIPHICWNSLHFKGEKSRIFKYIKDGDFVYFVHSYYGANCDDYVTSVTDYGAELTASVENGNVFGCQFHPEKSGNVGLNILKAFCELEDKI